jgi:dihydroorotate dehydrogenase electron transfer subunit
MPANRDIPLVSRDPLGGAYVRLTFRHPEVAREARAGQFVMIKAGTSAEPPLRRPFSILSVDPAAETFSLFLKAVGPGSRALFEMAPGEIAQCLGPLGRPFAAPASGREALLVAGGYGIAPFRIFSEELVRQGARAHIFYGGRTGADLPMRDAFADLGVPVTLTTDDGSVGTAGRVTVAVESYARTLGGRATLYACGPDAMLHAVARVAERRGLPCQVSLDPWMGCGVGTCLGCVVWVQDAEQERPKYHCACTEGPVFDAQRVVWPGEATSACRQQALARAGAR